MSALVSPKLIKAIDQLNEAMNIYPSGKDIEVDLTIAEAEELDQIFIDTKTPCTFVGYCRPDTNMCFSVCDTLEALRIREEGR